MLLVITWRSLVALEPAGTALNECHSHALLLLATVTRSCASFPRCFTTLGTPITVDEVLPESAVAKEDVGRPVTKEDAATLQSAEGKLYGHVSRPDDILLYSVKLNLYCWYEIRHGIATSPG